MLKLQYWGSMSFCSFLISFAVIAPHNDKTISNMIKTIQENQVLKFSSTDNLFYKWQ